MAYEVLRFLILVIGWPILVGGGGYLLYRAIRFYHDMQRVPAGRLVLAMVVGWLLTMLSLGITATAWMLQDPGSSVPFVVPVFLLWTISMVFLSWTIMRWTEEASTLQALYHRLEALVSRRTEELSKEADSRLAAEQKAAAHARELETANRDLREFVQTVSHDLQEPLRSVLLMIQMMERNHGGDLDPDAAAWLEKMHRQGDSLYRLVDELLEYARLGRLECPRGQPPMDPGPVFEEVQEILASRIDEAGAQVTSGTIPPVRIARAHLQQLFQNLLGNSLKFRHPGRPLQVEISAETLPRGDVQIKVKDNGLGIHEDMHDRVFNPFQRGDTSTEGGSGIGLATCRRIAELYGGQISVDSRRGHGATFWVVLPGERPADAGGPRPEGPMSTDVRSTPGQFLSADG